MIFHMYFLFYKIHLENIVVLNNNYLLILHHYKNLTHNLFFHDLLFPLHILNLFHIYKNLLLPQMIYHLYPPPLYFILNLTSYMQISYEQMILIWNYFYNIHNQMPSSLLMSFLYFHLYLLY